MDFFTKDKRTSIDSIEYAQYLAFGPISFQATRLLRNFGILELIEKNNRNGVTQEDIVRELKLPEYGIRVLLEAGLGIGLLITENDLYRTTKVAYFILHDEMTIVNLDFVNDICYRGMFELEQSILNGKPEGLKTLGPWKTVYEGLSALPPREQKSWFNFDHFYSSDSFPEVIPYVFKDTPKRILDIGGNTGKWAIECAAYSPTVEMGIVDLPGQLNMAKKNIAEKGFSERVSFFEANVLDEKTTLPKGFDVIWMSQFLDCFSEEQIVSILKRCREAIDEKGQVYILELFWDKQKYPSSSFSLQMTSLYFTNIANGNSQMYNSDLFAKLIDKAGLKIEESIHQIGVSHSLLKCIKK